MERVALVVDDNEQIRRLMARHLRRFGCKVHNAVNGLEALRALRSIRPGLILSDVDMPRMDGVALCHQLSPEMRARTILCTGSLQEEYQIPPGVRVLIKPIPYGDLCEAIMGAWPELWAG